MVEMCDNHRFHVIAKHDDMALLTNMHASISNVEKY
jgi:hypothetical protein